MDDEQSLLAAIAASPDDTPRLVYADFLDDHGKAARAEFIRVQCVLARTADCGHGRLGTWFLDGTCKACPALYPLRERERVLWWEYGREWFGDTALWLPTDDYERAASQVTGYVVRRGFPAEARLSLAALMGGECPRCRGRGDHVYHINPDGTPWYSDSLDCRECSGTGRTPGLARELVGVVGLTGVVPTDVRVIPVRFSSSNDGHIECPERDAEGWCAEVTPEYALSSLTLPTIHPTRAAALDALSAATLAYCRSLAARPAGADRPDPLRPDPHGGRLMKVADLTDAGLIGLAVRGGEAVNELVKRFPEFIVRNHHRGFVASVDSYDGDTEYTTDPTHARIFSGAGWVEFWARDGVDFWRSAEQVRTNNIPAIKPK